MKQLIILCLIPLFAGCFAWDIDEKPVPWMDDPAKQKPGIGRVVYYSSNNPARPAPVPAVFHMEPAGRAPQRPAQPQPPAFRNDGPALPPPPSRPPAHPEPTPPLSDDRAAPVPADSGGDKAMGDRLSNLENRLEELYQLILKSYENKKNRR